MKLNRQLFWSVASALIASAPLCVAEGKTISQPRLGYTLTLPAGWEEIPGPAIEEQTRSVLAAAQGRMAQHFDDGFQRSGSLKWLQYPYILVQVKETGRVPEGRLTHMKMLRYGIQTGMDTTGKKLNSIVSNLSLGDTYYDPTNKCLLIRMSVNVARVGEVRALTRGFLTEKGMLLFHCYAPALEFDSQLPEFQEILDSVRLSDELRYKPRLGDSIGVDFSRVARSAFVCGITAGLIGLGGLAVFAMKRLAARKTPSPGPPPLP